MNRVTGITFLVCVALAVAGCRQKGHPSPGTQTGVATSSAERIKIALLTKTRTNPFFARMEEGARRAAAKNNVELSVFSIDRETDYEAQAAQIEASIAQGVKAILIAPAAPKGIVAPLTQAANRGILIVNLGNRIDAGAARQASLNLLTFIGPNDAEGGEKAALELIRRIGGRGKIAIIEGIDATDSARQRQAGFMKAMLTRRDVELAGTAEADSDVAQVQRQMEDLLGRVGDLSGVFCMDDTMAIGAIQTIEAAGKTGKIFVTACENSEVAMKAIREGKLQATIDERPDLMGEWGVENAVKALGGGQVANEILVPPDLVTAETLKDKS